MQQFKCAKCQCVCQVSTAHRSCFYTRTRVLTLGLRKKAPWPADDVQVQTDLEGEAEDLVSITHISTSGALFSHRENRLLTHCKNK